MTWARATRPLMYCRDTLAMRSAARACSRTCAAACVCRWNAAKSPTRWRGSTATSIGTRRRLHTSLSRLERCDAFRKPQRFADILLACECDARGRLGLEESPYPQRQKLLDALTVAQSVPTDQVAATAQAAGHDGQQIGEQIHAARVQALAQALA